MRKESEVRSSYRVSEPKSDIMSSIEEILQQYFVECEEEKFLPGKTKIRVAEPTYGLREICEVLESLLSTYVTMGRKVERFEEDFATYVGTRHGVMANSGSSANLLAMCILTNPILKSRIRKGAEVVIPAVTWPTTVYPVTNVNLLPVFVDVNLSTYDISVDELEECLTRRTGAVVVVHLLGGACDMSRIKRICTNADVYLVEDACEALGTEVDGVKVGSFGDIGTFSFYFSHQISTIEGGMLVTNNGNFAELARSMRSFGWVRDIETHQRSHDAHIDRRFLFEHMGFNFRPTELQGAFGIHQLKLLDEFIEIRKSNAEYWDKRFSTYTDVFILPKERIGTKHSWFAYPLIIKTEAPFTRRELMSFLEDKLIETRTIMSGNMVEQPSMKYLKHRVHGELRNSMLISRNGFFFGNHQGIGKEERQYMAECIDQFVAEKVRK